MVLSRKVPFRQRASFVSVRTVIKRLFFAEKNLEIESNKEDVRNEKQKLP